MAENHLGENIKNLRKKRKSADFFPVLRMWMSTLFAAIKSDKGLIPSDIGEKIYIGENMLVSKNYMTSLIMIKEFSLDTAIAMTSEFVKYIKESVPETIIDFTFKNTKFEIDLREPGLKERVARWTEQMNNPKIPVKIKERNAWLLYSYEVLKSGRLCFATRCFILIHTKDNLTMKKALKQGSQYLNEFNIEYKIIKSDINRYLSYINPVINKSEVSTKDLSSIISSSYSLAEILPITQGLNDESGTFLGIDRDNSNPYFLDFRTTARAKNILVLGPSGEGKTFLVQTWLVDMFSDKYSIVINDIKGEFISFVEACGGKVLSMHSNTSSYVNTFCIKKEGLNEKEKPEVYFNENLMLSKTKLLIIANIDEGKTSKVSAFIEEFLEAMYLQLGVVKSNENTWYRTKDLTIYSVYEYFIKYVSIDIRIVYEDIIDSVLLNFKTYLDISGSSHSVITNEYEIQDIIESQVLCFDYGILSKNRIQDNISLALNQLDAKIIMDQFIYSNKRKHLHTVCVNEEFQMTSKFLKHMYAEAFSLRRAQNQINIILGNSLSSLKGDIDSSIILDNINIWLLGRLTKNNIDFLVNEFSLDDFEENMKEINHNSNLDRTFLLINKLHRHTTSAFLTAFVPSSVVSSKIFKVVDSTDCEGV